jgi:hypothetical protein
MKFTLKGVFGALCASALAGTALAQDLLFIQGFTGLEEGLARGLGYTTRIVTEAEFSALTTAQIASYKAMIVGDPSCSNQVITGGLFNRQKAIWSPAISGNIVLIGKASDTPLMLQTSP